MADESDVGKEIADSERHDRQGRRGHDRVVGASDDTPFGDLGP
jgi:hypothetical protein